MLLGAVLIANNSYAITPKTGTVNVAITYVSGGTQIAVANSTTVSQVYDYQGNLITTMNGPFGTLNLSYGSYMIKVNALYGNVPGYGFMIANQTLYNLTVGSSSQNVAINVQVQATHAHTLTVNGISAGNVTVQLSDSSNFVFKTFSTNGTAMSILLPNGPVTIRVYYDGAYFLYEQNVSGTGAVTINLNGYKDVFGIVTNSAGAAVSNVNAVVINETSLSYEQVSFSSNSYTVFANNWTNKVLVITSPGYAPVQLSPVNPGLHSFSLTKNSSVVNTAYSLSKNPAYLNATVTYNLFNSTPVPNLPNATVGSLYWQSIMDGFSTSYLTNFFVNHFLNYTNSSIYVGSYNYKLVNEKLNGSITLGSNSLTAQVVAQYYNANVTTSVYNPPLAVKIFGLAAVNEPGTLNYTYSFAFGNTSIGLSTASVPVTTYVSPVKVKPLSNTGFFTLNFKSLKLPTFIVPNMVVNWNGLTSTQYFLNTTLNNTVIVVPTNVSVSFNVSSAFYNPVTGASNYQQSNFSWKVNGGTAKYGYNVSFNFGNNLYNVINITGTSASFKANNTTFYVYAYNGTPYADYNISYGGKGYYYGNVSGTNSPVSISLPQLDVISLAAYNSTLKVPGTSYYMHLGYNWTFQNFTSNAPNATTQFKTPTLNGTTESGNLTVTGITGGMTKVNFVVTITVTTPPSPVITLINVTSKKSLSNPLSGVPVVLSANKTTDPYYSQSQLSFSWSFSYPNGTKIASNSSTVQLISGNFSQKWVEVQFNTLDDVSVSLAVSHDNVTGYQNQTLTMLVKTPRLIVKSVYVPGKLTHGSRSTIYFNVTNAGDVNTTSFTISILINGISVASNKYTDYSLNVSQYRNVSFSWTPAVSGSVTIQVVANNSSEPAFFANYGGLTTTVSISPPAYTTPLIIAGIILVIVVIFVGYYRFSTRGRRVSSKSEKGQIEAKPKIQFPTEQKKLEKKK